MLVSMAEREQARSGLSHKTAAKVRRFPETAKRALAFIEAGVLCSWRRIARKPRCTGRFAMAKNFRFVVGSLENDGAKCAARDFVTY